MSILYRAQQFWRTVFLKTDPQQLAEAHLRLTSAQWALFSQMQPADQAHAMRMLHRLLEQGENQPDLLVAALLHDVGKLRYGLNPFERAIVVLAQLILPRYSRRWSAMPATGWEALPGWHKAFIVAEHHAKWGADLAHQVGVSPLAEALIGLHDQPFRGDTLGTENRLLNALRVADNKS